VRDARLGAVLKEAREAAGFTQTRAGEKIKRSQAKVHRIESGIERVSPTELRGLVDLYAPSPELMARIEGQTTPATAGAPDGASPNRYFMAMRRAEQAAVEILSLQSERIPMQLQASQYTLLQYELAGDPTSKTDLLREKQDRERVFTCDNPPIFRAILAESSLRRMPGGRSALVPQQAEHLLSLIDANPRFSLQVLHNGADLPFLDADLTVLKFAGKEKNMVYIPFGLDGRLIRDKQQVDERESYWRKVQAAALSVEESKKFIHELTR